MGTYGLPRRFTTPWKPRVDMTLYIIPASIVQPLGPTKRCKRASSGAAPRVDHLGCAAVDGPSRRSIGRGPALGHHDRAHVDRVRDHGRTARRPADAYHRLRGHHDHTMGLPRWSARSSVTTTSHRPRRRAAGAGVARAEKRSSAHVAAGQVQPHVFGSCAARRRGAGCETETLRQALDRMRWFFGTKD